MILFMACMTLIPATMQAQGGEAYYHSGWGMGFQVGVGGLMPAGSLADDLKGCAMFTGGLNAEYNRLRIKADVGYGQPSFKNENPYAIFDDQGRMLQRNATSNPTLLGLGIQLGYTVWRQGKVSVTPMVGINWNKLSWKLNHLKYEKDEDGQERPMIDYATATHENSLGWMASIDIDIRLHGKLVDNPFGDNQAHYTSAVRITPFVAYASYSHLNPAVKGVSAGITLTYAGLLRLLRE